MAIPYLTTSDYFVGAHHPVYADTVNQMARYIDAQLGEEHDATTGRHTAQAAALVLETHTYTGTGLLRTLALQNTTLEPKMIRVWADIADYPVLWLDTLPARQSVHTRTGGSSGLLTTGIRGAAVGTMDLGTSTLVNTSGTTYTYLVFGLDTTKTYSGGAAGSDPTWIAHGDSGAGGASTADLNQTAAHIETAWLTEHADDGTHTTDPYAGHARIETGSYIGDGESARVIPVTRGFDPSVVYLVKVWREQTTLDWKFASCCMFTSENTADETQVDGLPGYKSDYILALATESFRVGEMANEASDTYDYYYYWCALGTP